MYQALCKRATARSCFFVLVAMFVIIIPVPAAAQSSGIQGRVSDASSGVLPGVIVKVTHLDTGTTQETVTNADGRYFFQGLRVGSYELMADLSGFATLKRTGVTVAVGESATINLEMRIATLEETVVVTSLAPLTNVVESKIGGNVNLRQMEETPLNGRQWTMMTNVAPGARGTGNTSPGTIGVVAQFGSGANMTMVNVDGAQINSFTFTSGSDLDYSQYAIEELEVLSNRFGAQHARAAGGVVNAVTKSGGNTTTGSIYGFVRHDAFNAPDFFTGRVRPFKNVQVGAVNGGPIRRDRLFYFLSWEADRQPADQNIVTGIPIFDVSYKNNILRDVGLIKLDYQLNSRQRFTLTTNLTYIDRIADTVANFSHRSSLIDQNIAAKSATFNHSWTFPSNRFNQITAHYSTFNRERRPTVTPRRPVEEGLRPGDMPAMPQLVFPAAALGGVNSNNNLKNEHSIQLKDAFSAILAGRTGEHALHAGGEFFYISTDGFTGSNDLGVYRFNSNPTDWAAVIAVVEAGNRQGVQQLFDTGVLPRPVNYVQGIGDPTYHVKSPNWGAYIQDDWKVHSRLTLNVGLRYDIGVNALQKDINTRFLSRPDMLGRPGSDTDNWQPRVGFVWALSDRGRTVVRGGAGRYYGQLLALDFAQRMQNENGDKFFGANLLYDGSPSFMSNPIVKYGGPNCTSAALLAVVDPRECVDGLIAAGQATDLGGAVDPRWELNYSDQYSLGMQHQMTESFGIQADLVRMDGKADTYRRNINLWVDCGNGRMGTYPDCIGPTLPVVTFGRPDPRFAVTSVSYAGGSSRYDALQVAVTKRLSQRHQYQISYILSKTESTNTVAAAGSAGNAIQNGLPISAQYGPSENDERHRLTAVASATLPWAVQVSGVFFASSGYRYRWTSGQDNDGDLVFADNARAPDGSQLAINPGRTDPVYRLDLRVAKRARIRGRLAAEGLIEFFNVLNHKNFISYTGNQRSPVFGRPGPTENLLFQPRMGQLGLRFLW